MYDVHVSCDCTYSESELWIAIVQSSSPICSDLAINYTISSVCRTIARVYCGTELILQQTYNTYNKDTNKGVCTWNLNYNNEQAKRKYSALMTLNKPIIHAIRIYTTQLSVVNNITSLA